MEEPRQNKPEETTDRGRRIAAAESAQRRQQPYNTANQIRLTDLLFMIRKRIVLIIICAAIGLLVGVAFSIVSYMKGEVNKQYQITTSIAVTSQNANGLFTGDSSNPDSADINLAEKMVDSVIFVLTSEKTIDTAIDQLNLVGISANDIVKNMKVQQYNDTQVIQITLYWRSAQEGVEILNAINEAAPAILIDTLKLGDVTVIDDPKAKFLIGGSISFSTWMLCMAVGLMAGLGIALLELMTKPVLLETDDMENVFSCEVLGTIPDRPKYFAKKHDLLLEEWDYDGGDIYDNFVSIAHIIRQRVADSAHTCIFMTSVAANEGKTNSIARLGVQLAGLGMKTLIVDFDTRNPQLGGMFLDRVDKGHSLNALYRAEATKEEAIVHVDSNLDVLPTILEEKPLPLDAEIFELVEGLKNEYDIILLDTSPIGLVANTMGFSNLADYAILVVRFDGPSMVMIDDALKRLRKSGTSIMGCVVNAVKTLPGSGRNISKYNKYGYGSYYGSYRTENGAGSDADSDKTGKGGKGLGRGGRGRRGSQGSGSAVGSAGHGGSKGSPVSRAKRKTDQEIEWEKWEEEHKKAKEEQKANADKKSDTAIQAVAGVSAAAETKADTVAAAATDGDTFVTIGAEAMSTASTGNAAMNEPAEPVGRSRMTASEVSAFVSMLEDNPEN